MSLSDFNTGQFNWRFYASNIRANPGQNLTLDASNIDLSNNNLVNVNNINFLNNQIKIGLQAGQTNQGTNAIAIGQQAGQFSQGQFSIAIGAFAGPTGQNPNSIILNATGTGMSGGNTGTFIAPIRNITQTKYLGYDVSTNEITYFDGGGSSLTQGNQWGQALNWNSNTNQWQITGNTNLAFANNAGFTGQSPNAIAIGQRAGQTNQGTNAIAIGQLAGGFSQGQFSIAIGAFAGPTGATANSIILNATGTGMTGIGTTGGTYIAPIRNVTQTTVLGYNIANNEVTYYVPTVAETNNLYDDFFSCPSNNPNTPLGPLGIQASTTSTFLSAYTGTKISGKCGIIRLLNPGSAGQGVPWNIYNSQPISFSDLPILNPNNNTLFSQTTGWSLSLKHFMDGTSDTNIFTNSNVIQFIGIFGGTTGTGPTVPGGLTTFPTPNWYYTVQWISGTNVQLAYYLDNVQQPFSPFNVATSTFQNWYTFKIVRTGNNTFRIGGLFSTSGVTISNINTGLYLRCGSYANTGAAITQNTFIYVDFVGVELNTRTS